MTTERGIASLITRAKFVRGLLIAQAIAAALAAMVGLVVVAIDMQIGTAIVGPWAFATVGAIMILWLVQIPLGIAYLMWLHRARTNLVSFGTLELLYSPAWAVGSHFVPLAGFVVPFRAMKETFNRSHGEPSELALSTVDDASGWWACTIGAALLFGPWLVLLVLAAIPGMYVVMPPGTHALLLLLSLACLLGATRYLYRLVGAITAAQRTGGNIGETFA